MKSYISIYLYISYTSTSTNNHSRSLINLMAGDDFEISSKLFDAMSNLETSTVLSTLDFGNQISQLLDSIKEQYNNLINNYNLVKMYDSEVVDLDEIKNYIIDNNNVYDLLSPLSILLAVNSSKAYSMIQQVNGKELIDDVRYHMLKSNKHTKHLSDDELWFMAKNLYSRQHANIDDYYEVRGTIITDDDDVIEFYIMHYCFDIIHENNDYIMQTLNKILKATMSSDIFKNKYSTELDLRKSNKSYDLPYLIFYAIMRKGNNYAIVNVLLEKTSK